MPWPFVGDRAHIEWLRLELFEALEAKLPRLEDLRTIPPDGSPDLRFQSLPSSQILDNAWPLNNLWQAEEPAVPVGAVSFSSNKLLQIQENNCH